MATAAGTVIVDYASLLTAVQDFGNRIDSSVAARAADFVRLGEDLIWQTNPNGVMRSQWGVVQWAPVIPANQNWVALPADWLRFVRVKNPSSVAAGYATSRLTLVDADALEDLVAPGDPTQYAIESGRLLYGQTSTSLSQTLFAPYYANPGYLGAPPLVGTGANLTTTWLLQKAPSIYLYAALTAMALYVKKMDAAAQYGALLDKSIAGFMSAEKAGMESGSTIRYQRSQGS